MKSTQHPIAHRTQPASLKNWGLMVFLLAAPLVATAQTAVFTDNFNGGSSTNKTSVPGGTPTASFTSYDLAATKAATTSLTNAAGNLKLSLNASTGSGFIEAQALFTATPVSLVTVGDYLTLTFTFTNTGGTLLAGGTSSLIAVGLFNSGGSTPVAGSLNNAGLTATAGSGFATGNCANWQGYVSRISNAGISEAYTRPLQNAGGTTSANQDLLFNNVGGGAFNNPGGAVFDTTETIAVPLTAEATYTINYAIALTAPATLTVTNILTDASGNVIFSETNTAATTNVLVTSFDGLSIGVRNSGTSLNPTMNVSKISVTKNVFGTPGPSFNLTGGGIGCPGDSFLVGLSGAASTNNYYLYTNGVFAGQVKSGLSSAFNFSAETVLATSITNTVLASNILSGFTGFMAGTAVVAPEAGPVVTNQPVPVIAANNSTAVYAVLATGNSLNYQWYRNGVALTDGGHVAGSATPTLVISPVSSADAAVTAQGYFCLITNTCGLAARSTTNSLTLGSPVNLVWEGGNPNTTWDLATTANFNNPSASPVVFNNGDNVTLDDTSPYPLITLGSVYLNPSLITQNSGQRFILRGNGAIIGSAALLLNGGGGLTISNANTFTGGATVNNGTLTLANYAGAGTGNITLAGGNLEFTLSGSATSGLSNNVNVTASGTLQFDATGTYGGVLAGNLTGSPSATLTILHTASSSANADRFRMYGSFTNNSPIVLSTYGNPIEIAPYNATGNQVYNGVISGSGRFISRGSGNAIFGAANTFTEPNFGYSVILGGGPIGVAADSVAANPPTVDSGPLGTGVVLIDTTSSGSGLFASGGAHSIANQIIYNGVTNVAINFTGSNVLTLTGEFSLTASDSLATNRTFNVTNTAGLVLAGTVDDNGVGSGITKMGIGSLYMNGNNTYTGPTTISNGLLSGNSAITGPVIVAAAGSLGGGSPSAIGTLTINNNLSLGGNMFIRVNRSLTQSNDMVSVSGTRTYSGTGTVTVTNLGPALAAGNKFTLFNGPLTGGATLTISPAPGSGLAWTNRLALDGSIGVVTGVSTTPIPLGSGYTNGNLTLSWPADHTGWRLQVQTNSLSSGLGTNWFTVPNSTTVNQEILPVNPANGTVFYRLVYP